MLVRFTIDPEAISASSSNLDKIKKIKSLISLWEKYGVLYIPGDQETTSEINEAFKNAPQPIQTLWRLALRNNRKKCGISEFRLAIKELNPVADKIIYSDLQLASLDPTKAELWGLSSDKYSMTLNDNLEICRHGDESETNQFISSAKLFETPIRYGEMPGAVWDSYFKDLIAASRVITVVDRYAFKDHFTTGATLSGLERFLRKSATSACEGHKNIHLISSSPSDHGVPNFPTDLNKAKDIIFDEITRICDYFQNTRIREINVHIVPDRKFSGITHYRYVKFDDKNLMLLDTGLEPLGGEKVWRTCGIQFRNWFDEASQAYRDDDKKLRQNIVCSKRIEIIKI